MPRTGRRHLRSPGGRLRPTSAGLIAGLFLVGLFSGRLVRPVSDWLDVLSPRVGWLSILALFLAALVLGYVAWATHNTLQRGMGRLTSQQAVNRLVLAKACAIVGAFLAGGYLGYAISWWGRATMWGNERLLHSGLAALAAALITTASVLIERACRVKGDRDSP
ncbi:MAG: DUF3180 family protein [Nocardioidaceae bacterium]|nr:MAG: DUF3180 family protein [Nocardioidaceae bacterium]